MAFENARHFFSKPYSATADRSSCTAFVLMSPGSYGRTIKIALEAAAALRAKLDQSGIKYTALDDQACEMEIGNTNWDKSVMRVRMSIRMPLSADEAKQALAAAGFIEGLPNCF